MPYDTYTQLYNLWSCISVTIPEGKYRTWANVVTEKWVLQRWMLAAPITKYNRLKRVFCFLIRLRRVSLGTTILDKQICKSAHNRHMINKKSRDSYFRRSARLEIELKYVEGGKCEINKYLSNRLFNRLYSFEDWGISLPLSLEERQEVNLCNSNQSRS